MKGRFEGSASRPVPSWGLPSLAPREVLRTSGVKELVAGSGLMFEEVGEHKRKGVPGRWRPYGVVG